MCRCFQLKQNKKKKEQILRTMFLKAPLSGKWQNYGPITPHEHRFSLVSQIVAID